MVIELSDYIRFYWALYYSVRDKYFPNASWRGEFPHRSPQLWTHEILGKGHPLGYELFNKGAKYFYLITTYFGAQNTTRFLVDDRPLIIALNFLECSISKEEQIEKRVTEDKLAREQFNLFKSRYNVFVEQFPDLSLSVDEMLERILAKISDNELAKLYLDDSNNTTSKAEPISQLRLGEVNDGEDSKIHSDLKSEQSVIQALVKNYYMAISDEDFKKAFVCLSDVAQDGYSNSVISFARPFEGLQSLSEIEVFKIKVLKNHATCMVYYKEEAMFQATDLADGLSEFRVSEIEDFAKQITELRHHGKQCGILLDDITISSFFDTRFADYVRSCFKYDEAKIEQFLPKSAQQNCKRLEQVLLKKDDDLNWKISLINRFQINVPVDERRRIRRDGDARI